MGISIVMGLSLKGGFFARDCDVRHRIERDRAIGSFSISDLTLASPRFISRSFV
jgi:hypothetical protein